jgi:hypothetical protein
MKTWMKYTRIYFINSYIERYGAASPIFLGQAHVIFAAIKTTTLRSPNLRKKGMLGLDCPPYPWLAAPLPFPPQIPP